jgi:poly-gamma-glutamate synthesis protein (capsule biosynthesis protein)
LAAAGIATVGAGENAARARQPALITQGGVRFAFLGYVNTSTERYGFDPATARATPDRAGVAWAELDSLAADVQAAKQQADVVIVMLHSGTEWRPEPTAFQRQFARAAIDAGATAVIGAHPHIMQGMEYYGDGLIAYSLGNFVFEAYDNGQAFLRLWVAKGGIRAYAWEPYRVATNGRPIPADARATRLILQGMNELTAFVNAK